MSLLTHKACGLIRLASPKNPAQSRLKRALILGSAVGMISGLSACQTLTGKPATQTQTPERHIRISGAQLEESSIGYGLEREPPRVSSGTLNGTASAPARSYTSALPSDVGTVPVLTPPNTTYSDADPANFAPPTKVRTIDAYVAPLAMPQFIDIAFGEMLKVPFVIGKDVQTMSDVVQLRSSGRIKGADFQVLVTEALKEYGVRVVPENGSYKVIQDKALRSRIPQFIKSRAKTRTRADLRPIIQFVEMQAVDANSMYSLLLDTFKQKQDTLTIKANPQNNYLTLAGLPEDVNVALDIINDLDELRFAGSQVKKYTPRYWNVDEFSQVLENALKVEGWEVSSNISFERTIFLLPVEYSNDLFIFAKTAQAHARVTNWLSELDRPVQGGDAQQIYVYQVKNVAAEDLAGTANAVLQGRSSFGGNSIASASGAQGTLGNFAQGGNGGGGNGGGLISGNTQFTVDPAGNRIIFTATSNDQTKLIALLEQLDTPAPEVLIEVQIAEVTLTNDSSLGVDFNVSDIGLGNVTGTVGTAGLGIGSAGLTVGLLGNDIEATLNAFASNRRVKILSTPILTARSGTEAEIQVGQDIPIITSQRAANNQTGTGSTDILQNIDYRETGVLMSIAPIVFSDNRIDLQISQEVSSAVDTVNSTVASPTISSRSLTTQLSLQDGQTAVMGGLIQRSYTVSETGVPLLKDIPLIGQAFSSDGISQNDTELVILITAYVLRGQSDKDRFVNRLRGNIDSTLAEDGRILTLRPKQF